MSENTATARIRVFEIHLHLVWVTKYRKPVLTGAVGDARAGSDPRDLRA